MTTVWGEATDARHLRVYSNYIDDLARFRPGERLRITIDKDRNGKFNSLFHLMLGLIAKGINRGPANTSIDDLKKWVKLQKGWYNVVPLPTPRDGITHVIDYHSTSFASMGEEEFHTFAVEACELIRDRLAPWVGDAPEWRDALAIIDQIAPPDAA